MGVHGHTHLDMISINLRHLFGSLSNIDHPLLPKTETSPIGIWTDFSAYSIHLYFSKILSFRVQLITTKNNMWNNTNYYFWNLMEWNQHFTHSKTFLIWNDFSDSLIFFLEWNEIYIPFFNCNLWNFLECTWIKHS